MELEFTNLLLIAVAGFVAPFALGLAPGLRVPSVVLEIVIGILIGPAVLGWVSEDQPVEVMALVGLAFLLFLAGLEIDVDRLRGRALRSRRSASSCRLPSCLLVGWRSSAAGVRPPLLVGDRPLGDVARAS